MIDKTDISACFQEMYANGVKGLQTGWTDWGVFYLIVSLGGEVSITAE